MNEDVEGIKNLPAEASEDLDQKLKQELSLKDNKEDVRNVLENAIEIKVAGITANKEELLDELVENKATILKEQSKAEVKINKHRNETETTEAVTKKDLAFFERNKELLAKVNINKACAKPYMFLLLCIVIPVSFITKLSCLIIKAPFEIIGEFATCIDKLFKDVASFSKSARVIAVSLLVISLAALVGYVIYSLLSNYGVIS